MLEKIKISKSSSSEENKLIRYVTKRVGLELSSITKPCYYLKITKFWKDISYLTGIEKTEIREFKKKVPGKYHVRKVLINDSTILVLHSFVHFLNQKKYESSKLMFYLLALKFYGNLTHRYFETFCNPELWNLSLEKLSTKHLFVKKGGISNAIIYLSDVEFEKSLDKIKKLRNEDDEWDFLNDLVYSLRTRINQSMRSFANIYYELQKDKTLVVKSEPEDEEQQGDLSQLIDKVSISISTHEEIDKSSLVKSIDKSGLRTEIGVYIVKKISYVSAREDIRFILILMDRIVPLKELRVERKRNLLIRKILSKIKIQKYYIYSLMLDLIDKVDDEYVTKTIDKNQLVVFISNYLTLYVQQRV